MTDTQMTDAPKFIPMFTFGKYKGRPYEVLQTDHKYAKWLSTKCNTDMFHSTLIDYLVENGFMKKRPDFTHYDIPDMRIIKFGRHAGKFFSQLPDDYLKFILNSTKSTGDAYKCTDEDLIEYAKSRINK